MSVDFTIKDNYDYCIENDLFDVKEIDDYRMGHEGEKIEHKFCHFTMNVANGSCRHILNMLGIPSNTQGILEGEKMIERIKNASPSLNIVETKKTIGENGCSITESGYDKARNLSYFTHLLAIANEAVRRGEPVVWW